MAARGAVTNCRDKIVAELRRQLAKSRALLADAAMMRRLSDSGQNVLVRIAALESQLQALISPS